MPGVFGDVDGGSTPFTAQRHALENAQEHEQHWGEHTNAGDGRQEANGERGAAHQAGGNQERGFAAQAVAHATEDDGAERSKREPGGKAEQGK